MMCCINYIFKDNIIIWNIVQIAKFRIFRCRKLKHYSILGFSRVSGPTTRLVLNITGSYIVYLNSILETADWEITCCWAISLWFCPVCNLPIMMALILRNFIYAESWQFDLILSENVDQNLLMTRILLVNHIINQRAKC